MFKKISINYLSTIIGAFISNVLLMNYLSANHYLDQYIYNQNMNHPYEVMGYDIKISFILFATVNLVYFVVSKLNKLSELLILIMQIIFNFIILVSFPNSSYVLSAYNIVAIIAYIIFILQYRKRQSIYAILIQYTLIFVLMIMSYMSIYQTIFGVSRSASDYIVANARLKTFLKSTFFFLACAAMVQTIGFFKKIPKE